MTLPAAEESEEALVLVNIRVSVPSPVQSGFWETVFFQMIDVAPEFPHSSELIGHYLEMDGAILDVEHLDPPEEQHTTHDGTNTLQ